jgi:hypothetical protein
MAYSGKRDVERSKNINTHLLMYVSGQLYEGQLALFILANTRE